MRPARDPGAATADPWGAISGYAHFHPLARRASLKMGDAVIAAHVAPRADGRFDVSFGEDGKVHTLTAPDVEGRSGGDGEIGVALWPGHATLFSGGQAYNFAIPDPLAQSADAAGGGDSMRAPMPGLVKLVRAGNGDTVLKGQPLLVLEAMKMEHTIAAPHDGIIADIVGRRNAGHRWYGAGAVRGGQPCRLTEVRDCGDQAT